MRFYEGRLGEQIDLTRLLALVRTGQLYSMSIIETPMGYEIKAEVVTRDRGISPVTVKRVGHIQFHSKEEAQTAILEALQSEPAKLIDWHLFNQKEDGLLCGSPLTVNKKKYQVTTPTLFFSDAIVFPGPRCCRCKTQAFVFGLMPRLNAPEPKPDHSNTNLLNDKIKDAHSSENNAE